MEVDRKKVNILMADDDEEDCWLFQEALKESSLLYHLECFSNGKELMDYLRDCGEYTGTGPHSPDLVILDLNMPVLDGRATLREIRNDPGLKDTQVMVLTESREEADRVLCYDLGVETFLTKKEWFTVLVDIVRTSGEYWFNLVCPKSRLREYGHFRVIRERESVDGDSETSR